MLGGRCASVGRLAGKVDLICGARDFYPRPPAAARQAMGSRALDRSPHKALIWRRRRKRRRGAFRMTVVLTTRTDIDLDCFRRVAWEGETVRIGEAALQRIA